jgi:hypothetical protein
MHAILRLSSSTSARLALWSVGPVLILLAMSWMLFWTWGTWPDVLVDFGRELYTPWQITEGRVLYRDLECFTGPLSQYLNAGWFSLFGVSLRTLVWCNVALLVLLTALLYLAFRQTDGHWPAVFACLVFIFVFAFGQYVGIGNYNYICPYAHEATYGLLLAWAALLCLWRFPSGALPWAAAGGIALGLAFLTKAEVFVSGAAAALVSLVLLAGRPTFPRKKVLAGWGLVLGGALLPPVVTFGLLCTQMTPHQALYGTLGTWALIADPGQTGMRFYRVGMGTDDLAGNLGHLTRWLFAYAAILVPLFGLALAARRPGRYRLGLAVAACALLGGGLWWYRSDIPWFESARPLPALVLGAGVLTFARCVRCVRAGEHAEAVRLSRRLTLLVFAFALLGKMLFNARVQHYGFVLAMPATLALVAALAGWLPEAIDRWGGCGAVFRLGSLAAIVVWGAVLLEVRARALEYTGFQVAAGADHFWGDERGLFVNASLKALAERSRPGETLAVLPEGVMINYLARRENPTPYTFLTPFDLRWFGEAAVLATFQAHPPDLIALVHQDTSAYGPRFFGRDYGQTLAGWIYSHYGLVCLIGAPPLRDNRFGIALLRRKPEASDETAEARNTAIALAVDCGTSFSGEP